MSYLYRRIYSIIDLDWGGLARNSGVRLHRRWGIRGGGGDDGRREKDVGDNEHADSRDGGDALAGFQ